MGGNDVSITYIIEKTEDGGSYTEVHRSTSNDALIATIEGLTAETWYNFRIKAENSVGCSDAAILDVDGVQTAPKPTAVLPEPVMLTSEVSEEVESAQSSPLKAPIFKTKPNDIKANVGEDIKITCSVKEISDDQT